MIEIKKTEPTDYSILFHACSAGAEAYSFLIAWQLDPELKQIPIACHGVDIEPTFIEFAAAGAFPITILEGMTDAERSFFETHGNAVQIIPEIARRVEFQPPSSFVDFTAQQNYDAVFLLNALLYVEAADQAKAFSRISKYNETLLVTTGFHADRIKDDMVVNGYEPVTDDAEIIHNSWTDRCIDSPGDELIPGVRFHPFTLRKFSEIDDWEYQYCSLFKKIK